LSPALRLSSGSPAETAGVGRLIGGLAQPGDIVLLVGPLGAGKTCLVQGIAAGLGISDITPSPTFMISREYSGRLKLYHIDLYRLEFREISELGLDEYLFGGGLSAVEWAEKDPELFCGDHLLIEISYSDEDESHRVIELKARGQRYTGLLSEMGKKLLAGMEA
jgi:tRNA threonylcarbamoyladenosine biosynthesis protein TsaE